MAKSNAAAVLGAFSRIGDYLHPARNEDPLIISGSPRGGTTWIAESIAMMYGTSRVLWEPLQEGNHEKHKCGFSKRPYVDEKHCTAQEELFFEKLMSGRMINKHTLRLKKQPQHLLSLLKNQRLIIKFVRGNGVVAYLMRRYNLNKPLVIVRHPCAVVASQLHMGQWEDHPYIADYLFEVQPQIQSVIDRSAGLHERLAMTWAADVLNARVHSDSVHIVYYEDVVMDRGKALEPVLKDWGWPSLPDQINSYLERPSSSHKAWTTLNSRESKLARWKNDLDEGTVQEVLDIVKHMGIEDYSAEPIPVQRNLNSH